MEVGREGDVEVTIPAPTVSKRHALFRCSKESSSELTVIDLESTNGTYINGKEVESMASGKLRLGDKITFGDVSYTLEQVD
jgi:pSer/pThr/pTyr-binding forkhead associated (FHA) protein